MLIVAALAFACVAVNGVRPPEGGKLRRPNRHRVRQRVRPRRILFPFVASALSSSALAAALRLARAKGGTLMARVPRADADAAAARGALTETVKRGADAARGDRAAAGRRSGAGRRAIVRGRGNRPALGQAIDSWGNDRIVLAAAVRGCPGVRGPARDAKWNSEASPLRPTRSRHLMGRCTSSTRPTRSASRPPATDPGRLRGVRGYALT